MDLLMFHCRATRSLPLILAVLLFGGSAARAADAPDALVKTTVEDVLNLIKQSKDKRTLRQLAEQKVLPHFDFKEMTRLAVGKAWREASPAQQQALENEFRSLLVNTYTTALARAAMGDRSVEVRPARLQANQNEAMVKTLVKESGRQPLAIDYHMSNGSGAWKVFDVVVENVSLVTTYRGSFSEEVSRSGIDGLVKVLEEKNRAGPKG